MKCKFGMKIIYGGCKHEYKSDPNYQKLSQMNIQIEIEDGIKPMKEMYVLHEFNVGDEVLCVVCIRCIQNYYHIEETWRLLDIYNKKWIGVIV